MAIRLAGDTAPEWRGRISSGPAEAKLLQALRRLLGFMALRLGRAWTWLAGSSPPPPDQGRSLLPEHPLANRAVLDLRRRRLLLFADARLVRVYALRLKEGEDAAAPVLALLGAREGTGQQGRLGPGLEHQRPPRGKGAAGLVLARPSAMLAQAEMEDIRRVAPRGTPVEIRP